MRTAIGRYHRALLVLRCLDPEVTSVLQGFGAQVPKLSQEQEGLLRSTQVDCYNNLAGLFYLQKKILLHCEVVMIW